MRRPPETGLPGGRAAAPENTANAPFPPEAPQAARPQPPTKLTAKTKMPRAAVHARGAESNRKEERCALPGFVDSKNEEKTERNAGYLVVSQSGGGMLRQGTREGIRRTPANRGMRAHRIVKGLDISEDVCHGMCP